jgi:DNA polymerase-3 subunit epsilon
MKLQLNKPLAVIDLETTGVNVASDRIVEICIVKINIDHSKEIFTQRINPQIPIPEKISKLIGIYDTDVAQCPTFKEVAPKINHFLKNCDFAGYNSNKFDLPLLAEEFLRIDLDFDMRNRKWVDVQNIFHILEPRTLAAAYKFYCNEDLLNAHSAEADTLATVKILEAQLEKYEQLKPNVEFLSEFSAKQKTADLAGRVVFNENGVEVFSFGKYKDRPVEEVFKKEPSYYDWMMKGDFPLYTKKIITGIRLRSINKA